MGYKIVIKSTRWSEIVTACLENRIGTAIAFSDASTGEVVCNPDPDTDVNVSSLFVQGNRVNGSLCDEACAEVVVPGGDLSAES